MMLRRYGSAFGYDSTEDVDPGTGGDPGTDGDPPPQGNITICPGGVASDENGNCPGDSTYTTPGGVGSPCSTGNDCAGSLMCGVDGTCGGSMDPGYQSDCLCPNGTACPGADATTCDGAHADPAGLGDQITGGLDKLGGGLLKSVEDIAGKYGATVAAALAKCMIAGGTFDDCLKSALTGTPTSTIATEVAQLTGYITKCKGDATCIAAINAIVKSVTAGTLTSAQAEAQAAAAIAAVIEKTTTPVTPKTPGTTVVTKPPVTVKFPWVPAGGGVVAGAAAGWFLGKKDPTLAMIGAALGGLLGFLLGKKNG
jgi:hypothetical protein